MSAFVRVSVAAVALCACATDDHVTAQQAAVGDTATVALYIDRLSVRPPLDSVLFERARIDLYYGDPPDPTVCDGRDRFTVEPDAALELPLQYLGTTLLTRFAAPAGELREIRVVFAADGVKAQPCADSDLQMIRLVPDDRTFELAAGATAPVVARLDLASAGEGALPGELPASIRWWSNDPKDALTGESDMPDGSGPVRRAFDGTPSYATLSPQEVFDAASRQCGGKVVIGLKSPKVARGYFKGHVLLGGAELAAATATAYSVRGVTRPETPSAPLVMRDGNPYPAVVATVGDASAIEALRALSTVDYVEPACFQLMGSLACGPTPYTPSSLTVEQDQLGPPVAGGGTGDLIPWAYPWLGVTEAWGREALPGTNMTIGVIDTGVHASQQQLHTFFPFQRGFSAVHLTVMPTLEDNCGHGTHIAGLLAAPKDGRNVLGIAWAAHLVTVRTNDDVIHDIGSQRDLAIAIALAHNNGARVINMSIGSGYGLTLVADTITDVFDDTSRPPVIFVAAAGTNVPFISFPATMNREVIAASTVEVDTSALQSQPPFKKSAGWTVSYGSAVDFVGVQKEGGKGIPTTGTVGDGVTEEIETVGGSSTGAAQVSGVATLAWSRNPLLTRSAVIERMGDTARRTPISGLGNYNGKDKDVGFGIPDAYAAAGGMRHLEIHGPATALPNTQLTLTADTDALDDQTFNYVWSGAVAPTSGKHLTITTPASGTVSLSVIATDPSDGHFLTATYSVMVTKTHVRRLDSTEVVDNWSITPFGGKDDTTIFAGTMAPGCSWTSLGGQELIGNTRIASPVATLTHSSNGFSVSSHPGSTSRDLVADVHTWWDGFSGIRLDAAWTVVEPDGVDCSTAFAK